MTKVFCETVILVFKNKDLSVPRSNVKWAKEECNSKTNDSTPNCLIDSVWEIPTCGIFYTCYFLPYIYFCIFWYASYFMGSDSKKALQFPIHTVYCEYLTAQVTMILIEQKVSNMNIAFPTFKFIIFYYLFFNGIKLEKKIWNLGHL